VIKFRGKDTKLNFMLKFKMIKKSYKTNNILLKGNVMSSFSMNFPTVTAHNRSFFYEN